jgi:hypothetical protein
MIRNVKFKNFYSFKGEQEISFLALKKSTFDYYNSNTGDQITKAAGFIGKNASGKTNVMRLFSFISYFACTSSKPEGSTNDDIPFKTFFNNNEKSGFSIEFEFESNIYFYSFEVKTNKILNEELYFKKIKIKAKKTEVFKRLENDIVSLNSKFFKGSKSEFIKNNRDDISLIAFLKAHYDIEIINTVYNYFDSIKTNINEVGEINNNHHQIKTLELYLLDNDLKKEVDNFIIDFDLGLKSFEIKKESILNGSRIVVEGIHMDGKTEKRLNFHYESRGTQSLFFTLANIFSALKHNSVVIIDEIEAGLHPEALNKLLSYFVEKNKEGKAQLIFSSHSLGFLNRFDMHQIYLTEKDKDCASYAYRLNQVKGIRSDENFLAKYMAGAYGSFPIIKI